MPGIRLRLGKFEIELGESVGKGSGSEWRVGMVNQCKRLPITSTTAQNRLLDTPNSEVE
jgi:hypothetical protein